MKQIMIGAGCALAIGIGYFALTHATPHRTANHDTNSELGAAMVDVTVPPDLSEMAQIGKTAFDATCATCHGENAAGSAGYGPPLVHKIYEPSHHGDMSFFLAVDQGVRAHHWKFGNMPAQEGLTKGDVTAIVAYVRELQRANGIN